MKIVQPTGNSPNAAPLPNDARAWSVGMRKTTIATRIAAIDPISPALGASMRSGTRHQNSTTTGSAANSVDHNGDHGMDQ